jgi:hypothetical protein
LRLSTTSRGLPPIHLPTGCCCVLRGCVDRCSACCEHALRVCAAQRQLPLAADNTPRARARSRTHGTPAPGSGTWTSGCARRAPPAPGPPSSAAPSGAAQPWRCARGTTAPCCTARGERQQRQRQECRVCKPCRAWWCMIMPTHHHHNTAATQSAARQRYLERRIRQLGCSSCLRVHVEDGHHISTSAAVAIAAAGPRRRGRRLCCFTHDFRYVCALQLLLTWH